MHRSSTCAACGGTGAAADRRDAVKTLAADPAWQFRDTGRRGGTARHYQVLPPDVIASLPVLEEFPELRHLWLWAPSALVLDGTAYEIAWAWGFDPKTFATWVKNRIGTGRYLRNTTEQCVFAVRRGMPTPMTARNLPSHFYAPRGRHSEKPPEFYRNFIERGSPGEYAELFGRYRRPGWSVWGDQVPGGISLPRIEAVAAASVIGATQQDANQPQEGTP